VACNTFGCSTGEGKLIRVLVAVLALGLTNAARADDPKWICLVDYAVGFYWSGKDWESNNFKTDNKYIVAREEPGGPYTIKDSGDSYGGECAGPGDYGFIYCNDFGEFKFDTKSMRFLKTYTMGYFDGRDEEGNTPNIELGKCTAF
jgi:hypothetical protein